jgi:hypothetical protein
VSGAPDRHPNPDEEHHKNEAGENPGQPERIVARHGRDQYKRAGKDNSGEHGVGDGSRSPSRGSKDRRAKRAMRIDTATATNDTTPPIVSGNAAKAKTAAAATNARGRKYHTRRVRTVLLDVAVVPTVCMLGILIRRQSNAGYRSGVIFPRYERFFRPSFWLRQDLPGIGTRSGTLDLVEHPPDRFAEFGMLEGDAPEDAVLETGERLAAGGGMVGVGMFLRQIPEMRRVRR